MSSTSLPEDLLLAECAALGSLARRLTGDRHAAADAVQDSMVALLSRPAPAAGNRRSWLSAVLRNVLRQHHRAARRRAAREANATPPSPAPSTVEVCEQLELHRRLLALVQALDAEARQALFLHFWRGMTAREIGAATGLPLTTVQGRLERGLQQLRRQLDFGRRGRRGGSAALVSLGRGRAVASSLSVGGLLLMQTKLLVGLLLVSALLLLLPYALPGAEGAPAAVTSPSPTAAAAGSGGEAGAATPPQRQALEPAPAVVAPASPAAPQLTGMVLELHGQPVAGVEVRFFRRIASGELEPDPEVAPATSGSDGSFRIAFCGRDGWLTADSAAWAAVRRPWLGPRLPSEPQIVVVAPSRSYRGTVVDPDGAPAPGARVVVQVTDAMVSSRAVATAVLALPNDLATVITDASGHFAFDRVGWIAGARLLAERAPFVGAAQDLPEGSTADLLLRLTAQNDDARLYGIVVDPAGQPVDSALVSVGNESVATAADGRFAVAWAYKQRPTVVRAVRTDLGVASLRLLPGPDQPGFLREQPITLQLQPPGELRGRVVDAAGRPVAGACVWTPDLTWLGNVTLTEQGHEVSRPASVEGMATAEGARMGMQATLAITTTTAADGSFTLHGLLPRAYSVFALAPGTLLGAGPVPGVPGVELQLQLEAAELHRLAGRVVSRQGTALPQVTVRLGRTFDWQRAAGEDDPWAGASMSRARASHCFADASVTTDAEGRFRCQGVQAHGAYLLCQGEPVFASAAFQLDAWPALDALEVVVDASSSYRFELQRPGEADSFRLCRDGDQHVSMYVRVDGFVMSMAKVDFVDGRSVETRSPEGEVTVVLLQHGKEVRRASVTLPAGGVHTLRL